MKPAKKAKLHEIERFLFDNLGHYYNPLKVDFDLPPNRLLHVGAVWPEGTPEPECTMELYYDGITVQEFGLVTGVTTLAQLHFVAPQLLLDLYYQGLAHVWVAVEIEEFWYDLSFQLRNGKLWLYDDDKNVSRPVGRKLVTPTDFFVYTRNYGKRNQYRYKY